MTTTSMPASIRSNLPPRPLASWLVQRGVPGLFLLVPAAAVLVGHLWRLTTLPVAMFAVFVSFSAFTAWVSYRATVSLDPSEPVHHLHRYALRAMLPVAAFTLTQVPAIFISDIAYWQLWSDLGGHLTGEPDSHPWSLAAGALLCAVVGTGLVMGYYVLFKRHNLLTATLYVGLVLLVATPFAIN